MRHAYDEDCVMYRTHRYGLYALPLFMICRYRTCANTHHRRRQRSGWLGCVRFSSCCVISC